VAELPAWSEELEGKLLEIFHGAPPRKADGGSKHTGLETVYLYIRDALLPGGEFYGGPDSQDNQERA
jgi:hypothetical protein